MEKQSAICVSVIDGRTFETKEGVRIRLAKVNAPSIDTPEGQKAKALLESLILSKSITYELLANWAVVWVDNENVNDAMRAAGYQET